MSLDSKVILKEFKNFLREIRKEKEVFQVNSISLEAFQLENLLDCFASLLLGEFGEKHTEFASV